MSDKDRIELFTMKGCGFCDDALEALIPFAKEHDIPLTITPVRGYEDEPEVVPVTCIIKEKKSGTVRKCIKGFNEDFMKDVEELLEEL
ncbi:hypothetical protein ES705_30997 [subsurface metagenome]